jgi:hypothetical protein
MGKTACLHDFFLCQVPLLSCLAVIRIDRNDFVKSTDDFVGIFPVPSSWVTTKIKSGIDKPQKKISAI